MKQLLMIGFFWSGMLTSFAQNSFIKIKTTPPTKLKIGQSYKLKVSVLHDFTIEKTGSLTCMLRNGISKVSVDGWFINIFPFQYFTTILHTPFDTEFSFTVPYDYKGKFEVNLIGNLGSLKDSVHFIIPTYK